MLLIASLATMSGCAHAPQPAPKPAPAPITVAPPAAPIEEPQVVEAMYYTINPDGKRVGIPGPDDDLVEIVRHQNGKLWPGQPVEFDIPSGPRLMSVKKAVPPYVHHITAITDQYGVARVYLQPLPQN